MGQIVKSLVFRTKKTEKPVLVLAFGSNEVDIRIIEGLVGESIIKADANFAREVTGFAIGDILPVSHKNPIDFIYINKDLLNLDEVCVLQLEHLMLYFASKNHDLLKATDRKAASLSKMEPAS